MTRSYTLKKRAEQQAETRQRIVEAAVELHSTIGPAATTLSMIAEKAGVQRHTLYAHFPDERSIFTACSGLAHERDPIPTADAWRGTAGQVERLTTALGAIYGWYGRNASLLSNVMRDVERHPMVQEIQRTRAQPVVKGWHEVLGAKLNTKQRAMLHLALSFHTWRALVQEAGLEQAAAVDAMIAAIQAE
ncbi:MAG: TetR family transcriptional regulator [Pseudolabrys sp.]|nr:TetR family transcriptional regulator [Pseudolabrys sp.]MDP2294109.1 TetR family transcriptional regulator [Pseudolabrys sp.]